MARKSTAAAEKNETDIKPTAAADENAAAVETMPTTTAEPNKSIEKRIYTGATVPGMKQNTVFTGSIPAVIDVPFVRELCMELKDYGRYVKDRRDPQSRATFCYKKSVELAAKIAAEKN